MRKFIIIVVASLVPVGMWTAGCRQNNKQAAFPKNSELKTLAKKTDKKNPNLPPEIPPAPIDRDVLNLPESATLARVQALEDRTRVLSKATPDSGLFTLPEEKYQLAQTEPVHETVSGTTAPLQEKREFWSKPTTGRNRSGGKAAADLSAMAPAATGESWGESFLDSSFSGAGEPFTAPAYVNDFDPTPQPAQGRKLLPPENVPGIFLGDDQPISMRSPGRTSTSRWKPADQDYRDAPGASPFLSSAQANPRRSIRKTGDANPASLSARDFGKETASRTRTPRKTTTRKAQNRTNATPGAAAYNTATWRGSDVSAPASDYSLAAVSQDFGGPPPGRMVSSSEPPAGTGPLRLDLSGLVGGKKTGAADLLPTSAHSAASYALSSEPSLDSAAYTPVLPAGPLIIPEAAPPTYADNALALAFADRFSGSPLADVNARPTGDPEQYSSPGSSFNPSSVHSGPAPLPMDDGLAKSLADAESRPAERMVTADLRQALAPLPDLSAAAVRQKREVPPPAALPTKRTNPVKPPEMPVPPVKADQGSRANVPESVAQPIAQSAGITESMPAAAKAKAAAGKKKPVEAVQAAEKTVEKTAVKAVEKANPGPLAMPGPVSTALPSPELAAAKAALMEPILDTAAAPKAPALNYRDFFKTDFWENKPASPAGSLQPPDGKLPESKLPEVSLADLQMPELRLPELNLPELQAPAPASPKTAPPADTPSQKPAAAAAVKPPEEPPLTPRVPDWVEPAPVKAMEKESPAGTEKTAAAGNGTMPDATKEAVKEVVKEAVKPEGIKSGTAGEAPGVKTGEEPQRITLQPVRSKRFRNEEMQQIDAETAVPPLRF